MSAQDVSLFVCGAGLLGKRVAALWAQQCPGEPIAVQTQTTKQHDSFRNKSWQAFALHLPSGLRAENVFFAVPPTSAHYLESLETALASWRGQGCFVFVSSTSVYAEENGAEVNEFSELVHNDRSEVLLKAEAKVLALGGNVLRPAGLYDERRGAHKHYLTHHSTELRPDTIVNMIHYDDAAELSLRIFKLNPRSKVFIGCDGAHLTRQEISNLAFEWAKKRGLSVDAAVQFQGGAGTLGKRCTNLETRRFLNWKPRWDSFKMWALESELPKSLESHIKP